MDPDFALGYMKSVSNLTFLFVYKQDPDLKSRSVCSLIKQVLFHNDFPLAVSSPNNVYYIMSYSNQLPVAKQYFANIAAIQTVGVL